MDSKVDFIFTVPKKNEYVCTFNVIFLEIIWLFQPSLYGGFARAGLFYIKMGKLVIQVNIHWFTKVYALEEFKENAVLLIYPIILIIVWLFM
jgi:hypothetical protein